MTNRAYNIITKKIDNLYKYADDTLLDDRTMLGADNLRNFRADYYKVHKAVNNYIKKHWNPDTADDVRKVVYHLTDVTVDVTTDLNAGDVDAMKDWAKKFRKIYDDAN